MRRRELPGRQTEILEHIIKNDAKTEYRLGKELPLSTGTIHYVLQELEKKKLLRVKPKGKARTGRAIKEFHPTVRGIVTGLNLTDTREEVDAIAERWGALIPLVLGKWDYLKEKVREDTAYPQLDIATKAFLSPEFADFYSIWSFVDLTGIFPTDDSENVFTCLFYDLNKIVKEHNGWIEALKGDPEIKEFIIRVLPGYEEPHHLWIEACVKMKKKLE